MKIAVIQFKSADVKQDNIFLAEKMVLQAVENGAKFIVLPEIFNFRGKATRKDIIEKIAEKIPGESILPLIKIAQNFKVCILAGSIYEKSQSKTKVYNSSVLISEKGKFSVYRKMNLFNAKLSGKKVSESDRFLSGNSPEIGNVFNYKVGLTVCYDLRFPSLYRFYAQKGVDIICVPSAFTYETGKAHWEVLLRSRAIETQTYIIAPNQVGIDSKGQRCYGHSMIVDPWGQVLKEAKGNANAIIYSVVDAKNIMKVRKALPGFNKIRSK